MLDFKEWLVQEARYKGMQRQFQQANPNMPRYVQNDLYNNRIKSAMSNLIRANPQSSIETKPSSGYSRASDSYIPPDTVSKIFGRSGLKGIQWSPPQNITVTPMNFDQQTKDYFLHRRFGFKEIDVVRNDKQRMQTQQQLMYNRQTGGNEPIIIIQNTEGFELLEGWHRSMNYLLQGAPADQIDALKRGDIRSVDFTKWSPVQIRAYVGQGQKIRSMLAGTGTYVSDSMPGTGDYTPS